MAKVKCELRPSALKPLEAYILVWDWYLKKWIRQDVGELEYRYEAKRNVDTPDKELDFWKNGGRFGARIAPYPLHQNLLTGTVFRTDSEIGELAKAHAFRNSDFYIKCVNGVSRDIFKQGQHHANLMDANIYRATRRQLQGSTSTSPFSGLLSVETSQTTLSDCDYMSFWSQLTTTQKLVFIDPLRAAAVNRDYMQ
jgi:hypothetical protein